MENHIQISQAFIRKMLRKMENPSEEIELPLIRGKLEVDVQNLELSHSKIKLPFHFIRSEKKPKTYYLSINSFSVKDNVLYLGFKGEGGILPALFNLIKSLLKYKISSLVNNNIFEGKKIMSVDGDNFVVDLNLILEKENLDMSITRLEIDSGIDIQFE